MLWTFGCSHTFGTGLPDCHDPNSDIPLGVKAVPGGSKQGWPAELAKLLNQPLTNCGLGGLGVKSTWHRAVTAPVQPGDTVVIMWPCWESRIDFLDDPENPTHTSSKYHEAGIVAVRNWQSEDEYYFENYFTYFDQWTLWHLCMSHVNYYFNIQRKNHNIRLIQTLFHDYTGSEYTPEKIPEFSSFELTDCYFGDSKYTKMPPALDGNHNGVEANQLFAQDLYAEMQRKSLI